MSAQVEWHWAHDVGSNHTQAGIIAAVHTATGTVTVYGVMLQRYARLLECSLSTLSRHWVPSRNQTKLPESEPDDRLFAHRYRHRWPVGAVNLPDGDTVGLRFECSFNDTMMSLIQTPSSLVNLSVRHRPHDGRDHWQIDGVPLHCAGFPIVAANRSKCQHTRSVDNDQRARQGPEVTICVPLFYGTAFSSKTLLEFTAWYLLLGAHRIVIYDSTEPHLERHNQTRMTAETRRRALYALARALPGRVAVVKGVSTWDFMRRTRYHADGQSLSSNLCKDAVGALSRHWPSYVIMADMDEFLSPPTADGSYEHRMGSSLSGALRRLAQHVHSGRSLTSVYLPANLTVARSRIHPGRGRGRCISFASIYYTLPVCALGANGSHQGKPDSRPAVVRSFWRGQPDNFERGPSHKWLWYTQWAWNVRAKIMVDARADSLVAIHECCCKLGTAFSWRSPIKQCASRSGVGVHGCAALEFTPLEQWHVRHLRSEGTSPSPMQTACRWHEAVMTVFADSDGKRSRVALRPEHGTIDQLPQRWVQEFAVAVRNLSERTGLAHLWAMAPS